MCTHNLCFEQEKYHNFSSENYDFYSLEKLKYTLIRIRNLLSNFDRPFH